MSARSCIIRSTRRSLWSLALLAPLAVSSAAIAQNVSKTPARAGSGAARSAVTADAQNAVAGQFIALPDSIPAAVAHATKLGPMNPNQPLSVLVCFNFADAQAVEAYANAVSDPNSLLYGQWLTPQEVGEKFGPDPADYAAMLAHLQAQGLKVEDIPVNRMTLRVSGTAAQIGQAFGVALNRYREGAADAQKARGAGAIPYDFYAPDSLIQIPAALAGKITSIEGLETYSRPVPLARKLKRNISASFDAVETRVGYDILSIYNTYLGTANPPGTGRTIAVSNFDGTDPVTNAPLYVTRNTLPYPAGGKGTNITRVNHWRFERNERAGRGRPRLPDGAESGSAGEHHHL